jgi:hypothetical protein
MGFVPDGMRIASGRTPQGSTNWQVYNAAGIFVDVDTTSGRFTKNPVYLTSIGGTTSHWATTGGHFRLSDSARERADRHGLSHLCALGG